MNMYSLNMHYLRDALLGIGDSMEIGHNPHPFSTYKIAEDKDK